MIFENIPGFNELSEPAKQKFISVFILHQDRVGKEEKANWKPVKVIEARKHIEVHFQNGEWLHYYPDKTWG